MFFQDNGYSRVQIILNFSINYILVYFPED